MYTYYVLLGDLILRLLKDEQPDNGRLHLLFERFKFWRFREHQANADEVVKSQFMQRMVVGTDSIPRTMMKTYTSLLTDPESDLRKANVLLTMRKSFSEQALAKRTSRGMVMRTASDVSLRLARGLTLDPWLLLESRRLAIGMGGDFFGILQIVV